MASRDYNHTYYLAHRDELIEKGKIRVKEWYHSNTARARKRARAYYLSNKEEIKARSRKWASDHPERNRAKATEWNKTHSDERKLISLRSFHKRKSQKHGSFTSAEWCLLCEKYDYRCLCCGKKKPLTVDHVIPLSKGGTNTIDNIQPLCQPCNSIKHVKVLDYRGLQKGG